MKTIKPREGLSFPREGLARLGGLLNLVGPILGDGGDLSEQVGPFLIAHPLDARERVKEVVHDAVGFEGRACSVFDFDAFCNHWWEEKQDDRFLSDCKFLFVLFYRELSNASCASTALEIKEQMPSTRPLTCRTWG